MRLSEEEVAKANAEMRSVLTETEALRDAEGILDPSRTASDTGKLLVELMKEKARLDADLYFALQTMKEDSPVARQLVVRQKILDQQIASLKSGLAGKDGTEKTVSSAIRKFEELEVRRILADKFLTFAEAGLTRARQRAERQNLYFMVFMPPHRPQEARLPSVYIPVWRRSCSRHLGMFALIWARSRIAYSAGLLREGSAPGRVIRRTGARSEYDGVRLAQLLTSFM